MNEAGATSGSAVITELFKGPLPETAGREARIITVDYGPGVHTPAHTHPGALYVYVAQGPVVSQMEGSPSRTYETGDVWYEAPGCRHLDAGNDSSVRSARLVVFVVTEPGRPILVFEDGSTR